MSPGGWLQRQAAKGFKWLTRHDTFRPVPFDPDLYNQCLDGYKYRDQLVPQEFAFITQCFIFLLGIMGGAKTMLKDDANLSQDVILLISIAGFIALFAYLLDLQANASCKRGLRKEMVRMEPKDPAKVRYWQIIHERDRFLLERFVRRINWFLRLIAALIKAILVLVLGRIAGRFRGTSVANALAGDRESQSIVFQTGTTPPEDQKLVDPSATVWFVRAAYVYLVIWIAVTVLLLDPNRTLTIAR